MSDILKNIPINCTRRWTNLAIYCYRNGCDCSKCNILKNCETLSPKNCGMKAVVLGLVRRHGKPLEKGGGREII